MKYFESTSAIERARALKVASEGEFLDGVFRIERYNRRYVDRNPESVPSSEAINIADVYPKKTPQELDDAIAHVRHLNQDALAYATAALEERPDCEVMDRKVLEDNPGFSQTTYELAISDGFASQSAKFHSDDA
jgi:hypothetical protein